MSVKSQARHVQCGYEYLSASPVPTPEKKRSQIYKWGCLSFASKNQSPMLLQGIYTIPAGDEQTDKMKKCVKTNKKMQFRQQIFIGAFLASYA